MGAMSLQHHTEVTAAQGLSRSMVLRLTSLSLEIAEGLTHRSDVKPTQSFWFSRTGMGLRMFISNKF